MKKMFFFLALLFTTGLLWAQSEGGGPDKREEMLQSLRVAYITKQLDLTPGEAEKFWPVYNKYQGDLRRMMAEHREKRGSELDMQERILNLRKQYRGEFLRCISEQKFDRLLRAEAGWGDMLRKELQRRREAGERPMMDRPMRRPGGRGAE